MNTLYLLSGPPRAGKTTIMNQLVTKTGVQLVATDALEHGMRAILIGEPHQMLRGIKLQGSAEYKTSFTDVGGWKPFSNEGTESEMLLQFFTGMMDYYRRNEESVAFEGTEFLPKWVSELHVPGFKIKAAFVGYTSSEHIENILKHARQNTHDWINEWLEKDSGDETNIRNWVKDQAEKCIALKSEAERLGLPFFDASALPFESYVNTVIDYFLSD